jgi:hypothetical protein
MSAKLVSGGFAVMAAVAAMPPAYAAQSAADQKIAELEAKVAALEARQSQDLRDVAATIDSVLRDAERRSQLLAAGDGGAGYDSGFFIRSGDWVLRPGAFFQFRNVTTYSDGGDDDGDDQDMDNGFEVRRMKLELGGTALTPRLEYFFGWNTMTSGGGVFLEDAWAKYMLSDDWGVRVGQFKVPFSKEWLTHDGRGLAVERSLLDATIGGAGNVNRTQGASLIYGGYNANNPLYAEVMLHDGAGQLNTDFTEGAWDFGVAGRVEFKVMGDWRDYRDMTPKGIKERMWVAGAAVDWSQSGDGDQVTGVIDTQYEAPEGIGFYAAVLVRETDEELAGGEDSSDWGVIVQASYLLNPSLEIFGRWDFVEFEDEVAGADEDTFHEFTAGLNYYLGSDGSALHRAKVTLDLSYLPDGAPANRAGLDYINLPAGEDAWVLRGQFQLWI